MGKREGGNGEKWEVKEMEGGGARGAEEGERERPRGEGWGTRDEGDLKLGDLRFERGSRRGGEGRGTEGICDSGI